MNARLLLVWIVTPVLCLVAVARGAEPAAKKEPSPFIRLERNIDGAPIRMQTSIVRYVRKGEDGKTFHVDLIGAVHIGDRAYYERLNREFVKYDKMLYELVAPEGTRVPKGGGKPDHPLGMMQTLMKDVLRLDYQLDRVDYHQKNFLHADMSPEQMAEKMKERGESLGSMFFRAMGYALAEQARNPSGSNDLRLFTALFDPNQGLALKRVMSEQFEDLDRAVGVFDGPDGSTILTERNKVALEVLRKQLDAGEKKLAVFYGAAHLPDMEQRLVKDFGLVRHSVEWITAWDMTDEANKPPAGRKK